MKNQHQPPMVCRAVQRSYGQACLLASAVGFAWLVIILGFAHGEEAAPRDGLHEPVFRVSKTAKAVGGDRLLKNEKTVEVIPAHPLDPALEIAREALTHIEQSIHDYTCTLVKRERVQGELLDHEFMTCKVRHERTGNGIDVPFSVYLSFRKPESVRGREVIFVDGANEGKLVAHEGGFRGRFLPTVDLPPTSTLALRGNRYPITEIGVKTLTRRLIEKGERDRQVGHCDVRLVDGAKVAKRPCTMLEVRHDDPNPIYDFHLARVFLDSELKVPIRYEAYDWPAVPGGKPRLLEEYTYINMKLNVGLTDEDFDRSNPNYRF